MISARPFTFTRISLNVYKSFTPFTLRLRIIAIVRWNPSSSRDSYSDQGVRYTATAYTRALQDVYVWISMVDVDEAR